MEMTTAAKGACDSRVLRSGAAGNAAGDDGARVTAPLMVEAEACGDRLRGTVRQRDVRYSVTAYGVWMAAASDDEGAARRGRRVFGGDGGGAKEGARRGASVGAVGGVGSGWLGRRRTPGHSTAGDTALQGGRGWRRHTHIPPTTHIPPCHPHPTWVPSC